MVVLTLSLPMAISLDDTDLDSYILYDHIGHNQSITISHTAEITLTTLDALVGVSFQLKSHLAPLLKGHSATLDMYAIAMAILLVKEAGAVPYSLILELHLPSLLTALLQREGLVVTIGPMFEQLASALPCT